MDHAITPSERLAMPAGPPDLVLQSPFPQYAYGLLQAATEARNLGVPAIAALELGVAGGNGLVELERLGEQVSGLTSVKVYTVGFDLGSGMPEPVDHRDLPYIWQTGFFAMDEALLRSRLQNAELVLGDIAETGPSYLENAVAPIGFISFDVDYYSSTAAALTAIAAGRDSSYLPRVFCYFDDTVGPHEEFHSKFTGELLAIDEFNALHEQRKIAKINGLEYKLLPHVGSWAAGFCVMHLFSHPDYNRYVFHEPNRQFPLDTSSSQHGR